MMQAEYNAQSLEAAARSIWQKGGLFVAVERKAVEKYYCLCMLPYSSGRLSFTSCIV